MANCKHEFIQTEQGKAWLNSNNSNEWFNSNDGYEYMANCAHKLIQTESGKTWFSKYGKQWLDSDNGKRYVEKQGKAIIELWHKYKLSCHKEIADLLPNYKEIADFLKEHGCI